MHGTQPMMWMYMPSHTYFLLGVQLGDDLLSRDQVIVQLALQLPAGLRFIAHHNGKGNSVVRTEESAPCLGSLLDPLPFHRNAALKLLHGQRARSERLTSSNIACVLACAGQLVTAVTAV